MLLLIYQFDSSRSPRERKKSPRTTRGFSVYRAVNDGAVLVG